MLWIHLDIEILSNANTYGAQCTLCNNSWYKKTAVNHRIEFFVYILFYTMFSSSLWSSACVHTVMYIIRVEFSVCCVHTLCEKFGIFFTCCCCFPSFDPTSRLNRSCQNIDTNLIGFIDKSDFFLFRFFYAIFHFTRFTILFLFLFLCSSSNEAILLYILYII